jgi:hypothetical protein
MESCVAQTCPAAAVTVTVCAAGFGCPTVFVKVKLCGVTLKALVGCRANVAVTVVVPVMGTAQGPVPLHPPPLQPVKVEPVMGAAVRVTGVLLE